MTAPAAQQLVLRTGQMTLSDAVKLEHIFDPSTRKWGVRLKSGEGTGQNFTMCGAGYPRASVGTILEATGHGWTVADSGNCGLSAQDDGAFFDDNVDAPGANSRYGMRYFPIAQKTQADDWELKFAVKFNADTASARWLCIGLFGSADGANANAFSALIGTTASGQYAETVMSDGTRVLSASAAQALINGTFYIKLWHVASSRTLSMAIYSDSGFTTQMGATKTSVWAAGKTATLNYLGVRSYPASAVASYIVGGKWKPISCDAVANFQQFYSDSPYATSETIVCAGTLDRSAADIIGVKNGSVLAQSDSDIQIAEDIDGAGYGSYMTLATWIALGLQAIASSYAAKIKLVSTGADQVGFYAGHFGTFEPTVDPGDEPDPEHVLANDTTGGVTGLVELAKVMTDAAGGMSGGTLALASVDPAAGGTLDLPALSAVDPLDTLKGSAGTMDVPALSAVDPLDTLRGSAGTMDVPAIGAVLKSDTLRGVEGGYNDDNLSVGNVRPVAFGVAQTGTLANLAATDAAYVALEASRNNDNGTVAADILTGNSVTIRNVTTTGTATQSSGDTVNLVGSLRVKIQQPTLKVKVLSNG